MCNFPGLSRGNYSHFGVPEGTIPGEFFASFFACPKKEVPARQARSRDGAGLYYLAGQGSKNIPK